MIDLKKLAADPDSYRRSLAKRGAESVDVDGVLKAQQLVTQLTQEFEQLRVQSKELTKRAARDEALRAEARELRDQQTELEGRLRQAREELTTRASWLPNYLDDRVPAGDETHNSVIRAANLPAGERSYRPHDEIAHGLGILDTERAAKLSGSRFYVLKGDGVRLRLAMFQLFLDLVSGQDFELVSPPVLAKKFSFFASGYLPFAQSDNFGIADSELSLTGTSEQTLLAMHGDEVMDQLPVKYLGDSMCFRTEAGSHGRDVRGMLRVHQFYKLEQFLFCAPDEAEALHLQTLDNEVAFIEALNVPSQTVICSSGDVAAPGYFKYDVEAWFPSTGTFRELTSNTNLTDYQTRRAGIRTRIEGKMVHPYTISATGFSDRHIAAMLENNQLDDGSVAVPEALRPYLGGREVLRPAG
ncbi:serine--tRNA ligase [Jatrophihabitans sp.]|uniref:serine--tRNA ligase n=1 Tax=Jatrophihabitans sp. TaxID=1932789 RepID=UPI002B8026B7|nr:serine--tRNA ligase [Jatrophihabitans sp.]